MFGKEYAYHALYRLSRELYEQDRDVSDILQTTLSRAGEIIDVHQGSVMTFDAHDGSIDHAYLLNQNATGNEVELWETLLERGLIGFVYHAQRTVVIRSISTDPRWPQLPDFPGMITEGSAIGLPLQQDDEVFGVMVFIHPQIDFFDQHVVHVLEEIADLAATNINQHAERRAREVPPEPKTPYKTLFDDAVIPILLTDLNGNIVDINRKASDLLLYDRDELINEAVSKVHQLNTGLIENDDLHSLRLNEEITFRTTARTALKDELPILVRIRRLQLDGEDVVEWVEQDITTQMQLEQLRRDLSAMVYHDLRGPLQNIRTSIHKLAEYVPSPDHPTIPTLLQLAIRSTRQLQRMVDSLLDVQRLEEGQNILDRNKTDLTAVLTDAVQLVQPITIESNQDLEFEFDKNLPILNIDGDMILRVVVNLIENASKYSPDGGSITVKAKLNAAHVEISVTDSGPGIPKALQKQIFDKFNRVRYTKAPKGLGLGLAFCRLAVKAHGGDIWVESEEGKGSSFSFTIPLETPPQPAKGSLITQLAATASF